MQNLELKAELRDPALARLIVRRMGALRVAEFHQTDTYFRTPRGRLKRRESPGEPTEWIHYDRPDRVGARVSDFQIYSEKEARERFGEEPPPVWLIVRKTRELWLYRNVRIHIDEVAGLGWFLEFEAMVTKTASLEDCRTAITDLRGALAVAMGEVIAESYSDMLDRIRESQPS